MLVWVMVDWKIGKYDESGIWHKFMNSLTFDLTCVEKRKLPD